MTHLYAKQSIHYLAADFIILGYHILEKELKLLLKKRSFAPVLGLWRW